MHFLPSLRVALLRWTALSTLDGLGGVARMGSGRPPAISPEVVAAVWAAEDGRCEACTRPMDRRCAAFGRIDDRRPDRTAENLHLLCVDCKARRPDVLARLVLGGDVAARITEGLGPDQA